MGVICTKLDISPEAARAINGTARARVIRLENASYEVIWASIAPYIRSAVERNKIRRLLRNYLTESPCHDRFLLRLKVNGVTWMFEITGNKYTPELTEVVLSQQAAAAARTPKN